MSGNTEMAVRETLLEIRSIKGLTCQEQACRPFWQSSVGLLPKIPMNDLRVCHQKRVPKKPPLKAELSQVLRPLSGPNMATLPLRGSSVLCPGRVWLTIRSLTRLLSWSMNRMGR